MLILGCEGRDTSGKGGLDDDSSDYFETISGKWLQESLRYDDMSMKGMKEDRDGVVRKAFISALYRDRKGDSCKLRYFIAEKEKSLFFTKEWHAATSEQWVDFSLSKLDSGEVLRFDDTQGARLKVFVSSSNQSEPFIGIDASTRFGPVSVGFQRRAWWERNEESKGKEGDGNE